MNTTTNSDYSDEILELLSAASDDWLAGDKRQELAERLRRDPRARAAYIEHAILHSLLIRKLQRGTRDPLLAGLDLDRVASPLPVDAAKPNMAPILPVPGFFGGAWQGTVGYFSQTGPLSYLIATFIMVAMGFVAFCWKVPDDRQFARQSPSPAASRPRESAPTPELVGRITGMVDCHWADPRGAAVSGAHIPLGRKYALTSGLLEITYDTGAKVILQGPASYEVDSRSGGFLSIGKLTAKLEKSGEKSPNLPISKSPNPSLSTLHSPLFTIKTPTATVTDLGTEFGVTVSEDGLTQVHVLQGMVDARIASSHDHAERHERVTAGRAVQIKPKTAAIETVAFAAGSFTRRVELAPEAPAERAYVTAVLADKPIGYWPLGEPPNARTFCDRSGHDIQGHAMNVATAGRPGPMPGNSRALELDGRGYLDLGYHPEFALKNNFTVEAWVWIGKVRRNGVIVAALGSGDSPPGWALCAGRPEAKGGPEKPLVLRFIACRVKNYDFPLPAADLPENQWLHLAVTLDRNNAAHLYLNGEPRGSVVGSAPCLVVPVWLNIGRAEENSSAEDRDVTSWRGRIAHVAVYPRALDAQQIRNHYRQRNGDGGNGEKRQ